MWKKVWLFLCALVAIGLGLLYAVFRVSKDISSDRESAKRLRSGLDNGKDRVSDAERVIDEARRTVGEVELSADRSASAADHGLGILEDIKKGNP